MARGQLPARWLQEGTTDESRPSASRRRRTVQGGGGDMSGTAREQILAAIDGICSRRGDTFTVTDVVQWLKAQGSDLAESTVRTHITSRMCSDSPDNHGTTYDDLERVDRGVYRLRSLP